MGGDGWSVCGIEACSISLFPRSCSCIVVPWFDQIHQEKQHFRRFVCVFSVFVLFELVMLLLASSVRWRGQSLCPPFRERREKGVDLGSYIYIPRRRLEVRFFSLVWGTVI